MFSGMRQTVAETNTVSCTSFLVLPASRISWCSLSYNLNIFWCRQPVCRPQRKLYFKRLIWSRTFCMLLRNVLHSINIYDFNLDTFRKRIYFRILFFSFKFFRNKYYVHCCRQIIKILFGMKTYLSLNKWSWYALKILDF